MCQCGHAHAGPCTECACDGFKEQGATITRTTGQGAATATVQPEAPMEHYIIPVIIPVPMVAPLQRVARAKEIAEVSLADVFVLVQYCFLLMESTDTIEDQQQRQGVRRFAANGLQMGLSELRRRDTDTWLTWGSLTEALRATVADVLRGLN